jgi:hypothetical protein
MYLCACVCACVCVFLYACVKASKPRAVEPRHKRAQDDAQNEHKQRHAQDCGLLRAKPTEINGPATNKTTASDQTNKQTEQNKQSKQPNAPLDAHERPAGPVHKLDDVRDDKVDALRHLREIFPLSASTLRPCARYSGLARAPCARARDIPA